MANQIFMRVNEVAEELGISIPFAYRIIRQMNEELAKTGCITIAGRIDRKFFHEKFYGAIKTDEPRTLDFSGVRGFLVTNVCIVQRSAA